MNYNYKYYSYVNDNGSKIIIAASTYEGKVVKGYAKCNPEDDFSEEKGRKLAAARCNEKISIKRARRSVRRLEEVKQQLAYAEAEMKRITQYFEDSHQAVVDARREVEKLLKD